MTITVDCPHQIPALRSCPGCNRVTTYDHSTYFCNHGEVHATFTEDVEGDYSVINGTHPILILEDFDTTCGCVYTAEEDDNITSELMNQSDKFDPSNYDPADYELEANLEF